MFNNSINKAPLIKSFDSVFSYVANEKWKIHKKETH